MDLDLRTLELASAAGDAEATLRLAHAAGRAGLPSLHIWAHALAQAPGNQDARQGYISAGGFYPERVQDKHLGDAFVYHNVNVDGGLHTVVQGNGFLQRGASRTWDQWRTYASRDKKGIKITSAPLEGAIKLGWFALRDHPAFREELAHYLSVHRENETSWPIYGKFTYGEGTNATLEEFAMNGTIQTKSLQLPTFNQDYSILALEQAENQLGQTTISEQSDSAMSALFTAQPSQLVAAFQYFTSRQNNGDLREVRLWTSDRGLRQQFPERALVFGRVVVIGWFVIGCYGDIGHYRPAVGWRSAQKIFTSQTDD